jgi:hypothetical protein
VVYYGAAVMLFYRVAVKSKTAALQHRNTKNGVLNLANKDFDIRLPAAGRDLGLLVKAWA